MSQALTANNPLREAIVREAVEWLGTPYKLVGCLKGIGANCATLLYGVAKGAHAIPLGAPEPKWYTPQFHLHSKEERLVEYIKAYGAREIEEAEVGPGDIVLYQNGLSFGHAGIVVSWPERIVHTVHSHGCCYAHGTGEGSLAAKHRRYFTLVAR